jgi:hypothetical protein
MATSYRVREGRDWRYNIVEIWFAGITIRLHNVYQGLHNDQGTPSSLSYRVNPKRQHAAMISAKAVNTLCIPTMIYDT